MLRRTFLKLGSALIGGSTVTRYSEPLTAIAETAHIADAGDYFIVKVPDFWILEERVFDKPVVMLTGEKSIVRKIHVDGFVNVYMRGDKLRILDAIIDGRRSLSATTRPLLKMSADPKFRQYVDGLEVSDCTFLSDGSHEGIVVDNQRISLSEMPQNWLTVQ